MIYLDYENIQISMNVQRYLPIYKESNLKNLHPAEKRRPLPGFSYNINKKSLLFNCTVNV